MYISSLQIDNYKTFADNQSFQFEKGFNLLVGPNNSGKTSVLDALNFDGSSNKPHHSVRSVPTYGGTPPGRSLFQCLIESSFSEFCENFSQGHMMPVSENLTEESIISRCRSAIQMGSHLSLKFDFGGGLQACTFKDTTNLINGRVSSEEGTLNRSVNLHARGKRIPEITLTHINANNSLPLLFHQYQSLAYKFSAQRRPASRSGAMQSSKLDSEAFSLPYCINHLQTNDAHGHDLLCSWVNRIFPSIKWVQSTPLYQEFEIRCLPEMPSARRDDLATPMSAMGTGLGNVLAMLYVVLTSRTPQLIAIDEPNAFLHPRALRELLAILDVEGKQHQFLLTAHSADVLTAVTAKTISVLNFDGVATTVTPVNLRDIHQMRAGLADIGVRITDLHAKDRVFWVEGQTEELVMPDILRWACPEVAAGIAVLRVEHTGTFSKKYVEAAEVARLYERLSVSSALVPPMVTILLDGELVTADKKRKEEASSQGKLRYLPRRMLENYLLDADAISAALDEHDTKVDLETVTAQLVAAGIKESTDIETVDGASILEQVFSALSDARVEFRKTRDVPSMVAFLIEHKPIFLQPLRRFLREVFSLPR